jgi:hypothetical protein
LDEQQSAWWRIKQMRNRIIELEQKLADQTADSST